MKDQINQSKGFLKEKLDKYQKDPPESVWNAISAGLGDRSRRGMVIFAFAAAASLAMAVTLGIHFFGLRMQREEVLAGKTDQPIHQFTPVTAEDSEIIAREPALVPDELSGPVQRENLEKRVANAMAALTAEEGEIIAPSIPGVINENKQLVSGEYKKEVHETGQVDTVFEVEAFQTEMLTLDAGETTLQDQVPEMEETWQKDPRWMIGAALSPLYTFRDVESRAMAMSSDYESGTVSYATGVQVGYRTTRRLAIESGVFYNKMGIDIGAQGIQLFSNEVDFAPIGSGIDQSNIMAISNSVGNIVSNSGDIFVNSYKVNADYQTNSPAESWDGPAVSADQGIRQNLDYLEVPLNLRYTLVDRNIQVQLVGGMSTNLLVNNYVTMETPEGTTEIGTLSNIRNVNYSGNAGIGLIYHFLDHFSLSLEPRFRYFLHSVNDATLPSTRPYTFGLYTGLNYLF